MIRRGVQLALLAVIGGAAWFLQPVAAEEDLDLGAEAAPPTFVGCVAEVARGLDGGVEIGSIVRGPVTVALAASSHLGGIEVEIDQAGGAAVPFSDLQASGSVGLLVELPAAEAAATVVEQGEAGTFIGACTPPISDVAVAAGGSTLTGDELALIVSNPYAVDALVSVASSSEVGEDSVRQLASMLVPARSTSVTHLTPVVSLRQSLSMKLLVERGAIHAGLLQRSGGDVAFAEAVEPLGDWWLPVLPAEGVSQRIVVATDSLLPVEVRVDSYAGGAPSEAVVESEIPARGQLDLPVESLLEGLGGLRISADGPVTVSLVRSAEGVRQITPAAGTLSTEWILPGGAEASASAWLFNPGEVDAEIVLQPLVPDTPARAAVVPAGAAEALDLELPDAGYLVRSTSEVAALSESAGATGRGLGTGRPVAVLTD